MGGIRHARGCGLQHAVKSIFEDNEPGRAASNALMSSKIGVRSLDCVFCQQVENVQGRVILNHSSLDSEYEQTSVEKDLSLVRGRGERQRSGCELASPFPDQ